MVPKAPVQGRQHRRRDFQRDDSIPKGLIILWLELLIRLKSTRFLVAKAEDDGDRKQ